ncbi:hypothetical protein [Derxia lacustris]|uniref:hypothetical protein n=1 Tax=Derxia lacustris TaxID=764842 RepID=UPI000A177C84|nr:hypothetical protein [Derxia lacustris]
MTYFCNLDDRQKWNFVAMRVRCALHPEHPEMIDQYVQVAGLMVRFGKLDPWEAAATATRVLLDTAVDRELPAHWRARCRANLPEQLDRMAAIALTPGQRQLAHGLRERAGVVLN